MITGKVANTDCKLNLNFTSIIAIIRENPTPINPTKNPLTIPTIDTIMSDLVFMGISTLAFL